MNVPNGMRVLLQGKADYLREIAMELHTAGIRSVSGPMPGGGWEARTWLAVAGTDMQRATEVYQGHLDRMVRREGLSTSDAVADLDAEETSCPACLTKFKTTGTTRCPECGLNFDVR